MQNIKSVAIFCGCTAWFWSYLVGKAKDRFSNGWLIGVSILKYGVWGVASCTKFCFCMCVFKQMIKVKMQAMIGYN